MSLLAIADTGLLVAFLNSRDQHHAWAVEQFQRFPSFLTCEAVLTEATHIGRRAGVSPVAVLALVRIGVLEVAYSMGSEAEAEAVAELLAKYADRPMDLADACLVRMTEQHRNCSVVTADSDFQVYRRHGRDPIPTITPEG